MKTLKLIGMLLLTIFMCVNFVSCNNDEDNNIPQNKEKVTISLGFGGEIKVSESPLTRLSSNDIYVVQIYYYPTGSETLTRYAYGLFSDISNISIDLYTNYKYEFRAWCFKKGMKYDSFGNLFTTVTNYQEKGHKLSPTDVENKFIYSTETRFEPINYEGLIKDNIEDYSNYYYSCYLSDYIPTSNSSLNFNMVNCVFGYSINVKNIEPGYQLKIKIGDRDNIILTPEKTSFETISHFYNWSTPSYAIWESLNNKEEFTQETTLKVTLVDSNSMEDVIAEEPISFTRNKMKNITIKLKEVVPQGPTSTKIGFNLEETEMAADESSTTINQE